MDTQVRISGSPGSTGSPRTQGGLASRGLLSVAERLCSGEDDLSDWLKKYLGMDGVEWDDFHYRQARHPLL